MKYLVILFLVINIFSCKNMGGYFTNPSKGMNQDDIKLEGITTN